MDKLDTQIIGELLRSDQNPLGVRRSIRSVAKKLGVDENTIRSRIGKLESSGFLRGWLVAVNPNLLGKKVAQLWLDIGQVNKEKAIREISLISSIQLIIDYFGTAIGILFHYEDEDTAMKTTKLIEAITASQDLRRTEVPFPKSNTTLVRRDWLIIRSIQRDPWKPFGKIANELALSTATVKRRLAKIIESSALYVLVDINPKAVEGSLLAHLVVFYDNPSSMGEVTSNISDKLGDQIAFSDLDDDEHGFFAIMLGSISKIKDILNWVKRQHGVRDARLDILQDMITFPSVHEAEIEKQLKSASLESGAIRRRVQVPTIECFPKDRGSTLRICQKVWTRRT